jgi:HAD superfamily hydrolase (TIGR01509 family)
LYDFDALLFDLDGTLVDTMPVHHRAYAEVFAARGVTLTLADYMSAIGGPAKEAIPHMLQAAGVQAVGRDDVSIIHERKKAVFDRMLRAMPPQPLPAATLLKASAGTKKLALVSSGNRNGVLAILDIMGWREVFGAIVTGDDVTKGKPHPEPYLSASTLLDVLPGRCLAFEDAEAGIMSARAAGMSVIDVTQLA